MDKTFTCLWAFEVPASCDAEFRRHYGPDGTWVQLFRQDPAYLETLLLKDTDVPGRYVTVDRWQSASAYDDFRRRHAGPYDALDQLCESLTTGEVRLGAFEPL
jgi:quinol monooxygenase YgiN